MIRCPYPDTEITLYYVHNKILLDFHVKGESKEKVFQANLLLKPPKTFIIDLKLIQGKFPQVLVWQSLKDTPVELPTAIEAIFALVANFVLFILMIVFIVGYKF